MLAMDAIEYDCVPDENKRPHICLHNSGVQSASTNINHATSAQFDIIHVIWLDGLFLGSRGIISGGYVCFCHFNISLNCRLVWLPYISPKSTPGRIDMPKG
jgi:hypothetical protein